MLIWNNDYSLALSGRMRPASTELRLASAQCWLAASSFIRCISASKLPVLKCKHGIFGGLRWQFGLWERQWWHCCWKYFVGWKRRWHCDRLHENNIKNPAQFYARGLFVRPLSDNEGCRAPFRQCQCISRAALTAPCQMQCSGSGHYSANLLAGVSRQGALWSLPCWFMCKFA